MKRALALLVAMCLVGVLPLSLASQQAPPPPSPIELIEEATGGKIITLIEILTALLTDIIAITVTFFAELLSVEGVVVLANNMLPAVTNAIIGAIYGMELTIYGGVPTLCYCFICYPCAAVTLLSLGAISGFIVGMGGEWYEAAPKKFPTIEAP